MSGAFVLDSVSCGYGGKDILSGFSASVERGALTALIGPNGSGKSTLLKLLGGVVGYRGSAELEGRELRSMSRAEFGRAVGFVPQQTKISSPFTVYEVIAMGRLPYCGLFSKLNADDDAAVLDAAGRAGVSHLLFRRASELSGGEQQRVYIAVALAQDPIYSCSTSRPRRSTRASPCGFFPFSASSRRAAKPSSSRRTT